MVNRSMKKKRKAGVMTIDTVLWSDVRDLILETRRTVARGVNAALVWMNFEIGRRIVEHEQKGKARAGYAEQTMRRLAQRLTSEFGEGYSFRNLNLMRKFYLVYGEGKRIVQTAFAQSGLPAKAQTVSGQFPVDRKSETLSRISPSAFLMS
jgi:hypothetical protein